MSTHMKTYFCKTTSFHGECFFFLQPYVSFHIFLQNNQLSWRFLFFFNHMYLFTSFCKTTSFHGEFIFSSAICNLFRVPMGCPFAKSSFHQQLLFPIASMPFAISFEKAEFTCNRMRAISQICVRALFFKNSNAKIIAPEVKP